MVKQIWLNLPVKNVEKSKAFFSEIGFAFNEGHSTESSACMLIGESNFVVMLFEESMFEGFVRTKISNTNFNSEMLISIDAESREAVDAFAKKVTDAGGNLFTKPEEIQGWMYGCAFADLDGHRWNVLYMDMSKLPK